MLDRVIGNVLLVVQCEAHSLEGDYRTIEETYRWSIDVHESGSMLGITSERQRLRE